MCYSISYYNANNICLANFLEPHIATTNAPGGIRERIEYTVIHLT